MTTMLDSPEATKARYPLQHSQHSTWPRAQPRLRPFLVAVLGLFLLIATSVSAASVSTSDGSDAPRALEKPSLAVRQARKKAPLVNVLQAATPVKVPEDTSCTVKLMEYSFGWSYDKPFVGMYSPPECEFNRVVVNFTVTSAGRQFDRLALMYLGDTEVWRTSTAEPTANGIIWSYRKDMSNYLTMWKQNQTLIFDLGNLVDNTYTGAFNTTLVATFFSSDIRAQPADLIIPVSKRLSSKNQASAFRIPDQGPATNSFSIPRNVKKAVFSISACGQASEEFWWSNVPSSTVNTFGNASMLGFSPWREVQLFIDGSMAGVVWPFPVIFTGGVVPGFWRPLVGIDAFDLKEDEIDVSPWLGLLSDGKEHSYEIRVVGINDDGDGRAAISTVGSNWVVTGKLFLWLDTPHSITKGRGPVISAPEPQFVIEQDTTKTLNGTNSTLIFQVVASRQFTVESHIRTSEGVKLMAWKQSLSFSNIGNATAKGNNQTNTQLTTGTDRSSDGYSRKIRYPLYCFSSGIMDPVSKSLSLGGVISRGQRIQIFGDSVFPSGLEAFDATLDYDNGAANDFDGYTIDTWQAGNASYQNIPSQNRTIGQGQTEQMYTFSGETTRAENLYPYAPSSDDTKDLYRQHVFASNGKIMFNTGSSESDPDKPRVLPVVDGSSMEQVRLGPMDVENAVGRTRYARLAQDDSTNSNPQMHFFAWNRAMRARRSVPVEGTFGPR